MNMEKRKYMWMSHRKLFQGLEENTVVWMSHFDYISKPAPGFKITGYTKDCPVAVAECEEKQLYMPSSFTRRCFIQCAERKF